MRTMERGRGKILFAVALLSVLFCAHSHANTLYTNIMDISCIYNEWYNAGSQQFVHNNQPLYPNQGSLSVHGGLDGATYSFAPFFKVEGTLTFTADMLDDYSSGGFARAYFEGGVTVTVEGSIKHAFNPALTYYTGTILQGQLVPVYDDASNPTEERWSLEEADLQEGVFNKTLFWDYISGDVGLGAGITLSTGDVLKLYHPNKRVDMSLFTSSASDFLSSNLESDNQASHFKFVGVEIPEPMSILLLAFGGLAVSRVKK